MGNSTNTFLTDRIELLLRSFKRYSLYTKDQCLEYLGTRFAVMLDSPDDMLALDVGLEFLKKVILVHLNDYKAKSDMLM
jgi:DNA-directed RNA polymerase I subunit RPA2